MRINSGHCGRWGFIMEYDGAQPNVKNKYGVDGVVQPKKDLSQPFWWGNTKYFEPLLGCASRRLVVKTHVWVVSRHITSYTYFLNVSRTIKQPVGKGHLQSKNGYLGGPWRKKSSTYASSRLKFNTKCAHSAN